MTKALITGASGFVGRYLIRELETHNTDLTCVTTNKRNITGPQWVEADVRDVVSITSLINDVKPDEIYHLAALSKPTGNDYREYFDVNLYGTLNVLNAARNCEASVLVVGSAYAYGKQCRLIDEETALSPVNVYGASKAAQDVLACSYSFDSKVVRVRPFNHTGAGQDQAFLVPGLIKRILAATDARAISIGNVSSVRDFLDVRDVVKAYRKLLRETSHSDVFNVCSGSGHSVEEIFNLVKDCTRKEVSYVASEELIRETDIEMLVGDNKKLMKLTDWKQEYSFRETVMTIVNSLNKKDDDS